MNDIKRTAGFIDGEEIHYLDHLATLCHLLDIPLILTEEKMVHLAHAYYPKLKVLFWNSLEVTEKLVQNFERIFYSTPRILFDQRFFFAQKLLNKSIQTIWCPHGNSDKGKNSFFMEALRDEETLLIYGQRMLDFFYEKKVPLKKHALIGNYRYYFYQEHQEFYQELIHREIGSKLQKYRFLYLYAPTWQDYEKNSSFCSAPVQLLNALPQEDALIIKWHPNLLKQFPEIVHQIEIKYKNNPNIIFLNDFTPIYPLLNLVDIYIGDMSSIGYDFLVFNRPMFFLNENKKDPNADASLYLTRSGVVIEPESYSQLFDEIKAHLSRENKNLNEVRKKLYLDTFGLQKSKEELKQELLNL